jgi:hypothetical protein
MAFTGVILRPLPLDRRVYRPKVLGDLLIIDFIHEAEIFHDDDTCQ